MMKKLPAGIVGSKKWKYKMGQFIEGKIYTEAQERNAFQAWCDTQRAVEKKQYAKKDKLKQTEFFKFVMNEINKAAEDGKSCVSVSVSHPENFNSRLYPSDYFGFNFQEMEVLKMLISWDYEIQFDWQCNSIVDAISTANICWER